MKDFLFKGELGASKSLFNRALIISSYNPDIKVLGQSHSDDIDLLKAAIANLDSQTEFDCGAAGTVLRFFALRLARKKGIFKLKGTKKLFTRLLPQLQQTLSQLGAESRMLDDETLQLDCDGWRPRGDGLWIPSGESSQFASAILLNAWDLDMPIHFVRSGELVSDSYFQMTVDLVRGFGMNVELHDKEVSIPAKQNPSAVDYQVECDVSSAFAVAALASQAGECHIRNFPERPLQPDSIFVSYLIRMGVELSQTSEGLKVKKTNGLLPLDVDLKNSPDLFPVLSVLCSAADGESKFQGLSHLEHKESNRIEKIKELTEAMGASWTGDAYAELVLTPPSESHSKDIQFHAEEDHRLVMAAALAQAMGYSVQITGTECVSKSFKGFEDIWSLC